MTRLRDEQVGGAVAWLIATTQPGPVDLMLSWLVTTKPTTTISSSVADDPLKPLLRMLLLAPLLTGVLGASSLSALSRLSSHALSSSGSSSSLSSHALSTSSSSAAAAARRAAARAARRTSSPSLRSMLLLVAVVVLVAAAAVEWLRVVGALNGAAFGYLIHGTLSQSQSGRLRGFNTEPRDSSNEPKQAHQAASHQHSIWATQSNPLLKRFPVFTRERCEGFQRATLFLTHQYTITSPPPMSSVPKALTSGTHSPAAPPPLPRRESIDLGAALHVESPGAAGAGGVLDRGAGGRVAGGEFTLPSPLLPSPTRADVRSFQPATDESANSRGPPRWTPRLLELQRGYGARPLEL